MVACFDPPDMPRSCRFLTLLQARLVRRDAATHPSSCFEAGPVLSHTSDAKMGSSFSKWQYRAAMGWNDIARYSFGVPVYSIVLSLTTATRPSDGFPSRLPSMFLTKEGQWRDRVSSGKAATRVWRWFRRIKDISFTRHPCW